MGFLDYLNNYEKKFETKIVTEQPKKVIEQKVVKENVVVHKKTIKIIKKPVVKNVKSLSEHINKAINILDGIEDYGGNIMMPSSSRFYDNTSFSSKQNINIDSKGVASRANDLLSESNDSVGNGVLPQPLMNIPQMDVDMLKFVPKEMLTEEQKLQVQTVQNQPIVDSKQNMEVHPEILSLMEETRKLQEMFVNVDTSSISPEFLPK